MVDSNCPSKYELVAFCHGRLPDNALDQVASHLGECEDCEQRYSVIESSRGSHSQWLDVFPQKAAESAADESGESLSLHFDEEELQRLLRRAKQLQPSDAETLMVSAASFSVPPKLGQVHLLRRLEQGGMGAVYQGRDEGLDCLVAVKVLRPDLGRRHDLVERFDREMKVIGQLNHPNLVRARTAGRQGDFQYIVMDLISGVDLSRLVRLTGPLDVADACEIALQTALGLEHLAHLGLVHRDIKPKNVMLTAEGEVKILDLGLARLRYNGSDVALTGSHVVVGTFDYVAPEQTQKSDPDTRADIYSLGCTLFKLLTGRAPFSGSQYDSSHAKLLAHCTAPIPDVRQERSDVPDELAETLHRMLAKSPRDRLQTPHEVHQQLAPFTKEANLGKLAQLAVSLQSEETVALEDDGIEAVDTSQSLDTQVHSGSSSSPVVVPPETTRPPRRRNAVLVGLAAIFVALGVWMTVANSSRPSWDPMTLDQDATPLRWYNLLEHEPVRLWPSGWDTARVSYNPELEDVMVEEPDIVLLRQGTTNSADYRLQVEVSKTALTGSAGLFWGYGVHPELKQQQFQAVYIRSYHDGKGKLITELTREISTMSKGFPNARPMLDTSYVALQPVSFSGKGVLDLEVRRGVVQRIRWRGADCEDLIVFDEPGTDHNAGDFGIVGRHGATLFRDARFQLFN